MTTGPADAAAVVLTYFKPLAATSISTMCPPAALDTADDTADETADDTPAGADPAVVADEDAPESRPRRRPSSYLPPLLPPRTPPRGSNPCALQSCLCLDAAGLDRIDKRVVVTLVLVGVGFGEVCDATVEGVAAAQIRGDRNIVTRAGVGTSE